MSRAGTVGSTPSGGATLVGTRHGWASPMLSPVVAVLLPFALMAATAIGLVVPDTRGAMLWLLEENHPVEMATFVLLVVAGVMALKLGFKGRATREPRIASPFFVLFGVAMIVVGLEEISWGQQLIRFDTPEALAPANAQGEINLHNLSAIQGRSELFRLGFTLGGFLGLAAWRWRPALRPIAMPPVLTPWLILILVHVTVDLFTDLGVLGPRFDHDVQRLSELAELLIASLALLFAYLHLTGRCDESFTANSSPVVGASLER